MLKNPKTEAKSETKRLLSTSGQRETLPDSGSHHLFNTLLLLNHSRPFESIECSNDQLGLHALSPEMKAGVPRRDVDRLCSRPMIDDRRAVALRNVAVFPGDSEHGRRRVRRGRKVGDVEREE